LTLESRSSKLRRQLLCAFAGVHHRAERADHRQNAGDVALVEHMNGDAGARQLCGDLGLQIGEAQHKVRIECEDLRHIGRDERGHPRLFAPHLRRPHRIAGNADDAILFAEQIQRLHGLFREADDPAWREVAHDVDMPVNKELVTACRCVVKFHQARMMMGKTDCRELRPA
jgi:hypothetical protein